MSQSQYQQPDQPVAPGPVPMGGAPPAPAQQAAASASPTGPVPDGLPGLVAKSGTAPAARGGGTIAEVRGVGKKFGDLQAIENLSLTVNQGGLIGVIGPSGCGKTTTIRLLLGVYEPDEGEIQVFGEKPHRFHRATRERLGYLPQQFVLYPTLSVDENLNFAAATYGLGPFKRRAAKAQVLELVGLTDHRRSLAGDISGGMQRRLMLAATLLHQPEFVFLDEPTAGIDPILREQLWTEFRRLQALGTTQVITTQYVTEAEYCDFVLLMDHGTIVASGSPDELRRQASGGELIEVTIPNLDNTTLRRLRSVPNVQAVHLLSDVAVRLVVAEDAAETIPQVMAALQETDCEAQSIEERRLSFNEVFVVLLERAGHATGEIRDNDE